METTFNERKARSVTNKTEAKDAIREFLREGLNPHSRHNIAERSKGYDLYLPWLIEVIEYVHPLEGVEALPIPKLHRLYMDAAWEMAMEGVLRPGPKDIAGGGDANAYGRAYSLVEGANL